MKIRTNYVSNSSSSSFLIIYKDISDFSKFEPFKGYERFCNDLNNSNYEKGLEHLKSIIFESLYDEYDSRTQFKKIYCSNNVYHIMIMADMKLDEYQNLVYKIEELADDFYEKIIDKYPGLIHEIQYYENYHMMPGKEEEKKFIEKCQDEFQEAFYDETFYGELEKSSNELAEKIMEKLKEKNYEVRSISYEDHTEEGSMMETGFMPFIAKNHERNYEIITTYEH